MATVQHKQPIQIVGVTSKLFLGSVKMVQLSSISLSDDLSSPWILHRSVGQCLVFYLLARQLLGETSHKFI